MSVILHRKILCILQLPPPLHGASIMNSYVIKSDLIRRNYNIDFINLHFAKSIEELDKFTFQKIIKAFYYGFEIVRSVIIKKPDLLYFNLTPIGFAFYRDAIYVFLLKVLKRRIALHLHSKGIKNNSENCFFKKYFYKRVFKNTYVICLSKNLTDEIAEVYKSKPFIVPNGIQLQSQSDDMNHRSNRLIPGILFLSHFLRSKGILVLIEALGILKSQGYLFNARFIGAPADLSIEILENEITKEDLTEAVKIIGPLYGDKKNLEFKNADIFVFPSFNDAYPLVILEAMQFSLPVVSTFEGSIPEIVIPGETGFLVETRNAKMLAEKTAILLNDKDLRIKMGINGYKRYLNNFTLNHFENNMNRTFQTILGI